MTILVHQDQNGGYDKDSLDLLEKYIGTFGKQHMQRYGDGYCLFAFTPNNDGGATLFFLRPRVEKEPVMFSVDTNQPSGKRTNYGSVAIFVLSEHMPPFDPLSVLTDPQKYAKAYSEREKY